MKTISIRQPWAALIVHGFKPIENRSRRANYRGPIAIHAGLFRPPAALLAEIEKHFRVKIPPLQYGGVIGTAEIVDCVTQSRSKWFWGPFGFVLRNAKPVPFIPCQGALGFFNIDFPSIEAARRSRNSGRTKTK